jgi:putative spermidine/putrescine transport system permease protein
MILRLSTPKRRQWLDWPPGLSLLLLPLGVFLFFFVLPTGALLALSLNHPSDVTLTVQPQLTLENYCHFFGGSLYVTALVRSFILSIVVVLLALALGYPLAYVMARTRDPRRTNLYLMLVLIPLQVDTIIRAYGLMILLGDVGLINSTLLRWGLIEQATPMMFNSTGVVIALLHTGIPIMVLSLMGVLRDIDPVLEEAARNLGASQWQAFVRGVWPLSLPGVLACSLLVFGLGISAYTVPALLGGGKVVTLSTLMFDQIQHFSRWQFGTAIGVVLLITTLPVVYVYHWAIQRHIGGLV